MDENNPNDYKDNSNDSDKLPVNPEKDTIENPEKKEDDKKSPGGLDWKEFRDWVKTIGLAVILAFIIVKFILFNGYVPSGSMEKTIMVNDRIFANRLIYKFSEPKRGDIIVFKYPDDPSMYFVKRLIGLPGETVSIKGGQTYINGKKLNEPYLNEKPYDQDFGPYKVPKGKYFMMGDNRNNSKDSRFWNNTYVDKSQIIGKVFIEYFPKIKLISGYNYDK